MPHPRRVLPVPIDPGDDPGDGVGRRVPAWASDTPAQWSERWVDHDAEADDDLLCLREAAPHLMAGLTPLEQRLVREVFGFGCPRRSLGRIAYETGLDRATLDAALAHAIGVLRRRLA